jgi:hypothetical protein
MDKCRVYWGSHGCDKPRGHRGHHRCGSCSPWWLRFVPPILRIRVGGNVGMYPYYGPGTNFYGEDAPADARSVICEYEGHEYGWGFCSRCGLPLHEHSAREEVVE